MCSLEEPVSAYHPLLFCHNETSILLITLKGEINKKMALKQGERNSYVRKKMNLVNLKRKQCCSDSVQYEIDTKL